MYNHLLHLCFLFLSFRPLSPASVVPAVTALLNHLLREIETDKLGKGLFSFSYLKHK